MDNFTHREKKSSQEFSTLFAEGVIHFSHFFYWFPYAYNPISLE